MAPRGGIEMAKAGTAKSGHTVVLVHGIRTHAQWYPRAEEVFSSIEGVEVEAIKYGRFDLLRFLLPGPWRRGPIDKTERILLPILKDCERRKRPVTVIAHSNGTNVIAQILKRNHAVEIDNLIMCGAVVDTGYDWGAVAHKVKGRIINDYGVKDMWPAFAHSITWGYGYSGTNGIGSPVDDRMHDTNHSAYFDREFIETYWASFLRDGTFIKPRYGGAEPASPWWFGLFEVPWKWVILLALIAAAVWAFLSWNGGDVPAQPAEGVAPGEEPAAETSDSAEPGPVGASGDEIPAFELACTAGLPPPRDGEVQRALEDAALVNTRSWLQIAAAEIGQRERPGPSANPRILRYMENTRHAFDSDEEPWNSQFVNFVMEQDRYAGTDDGRAQSWLSWGKDSLEVGEPVVGAIVVASRVGMPQGGVAGFYLGYEPPGSIRMLGGNLCGAVGVVTVPEDRVLGYRLPSDWVGPAQ
jgi:uncharacterized protein (TIGR02594 family)